MKHLKAICFLRPTKVQTRLCLCLWGGRTFVSVIIRKWTVCFLQENVQHLIQELRRPKYSVYVICKRIQLSLHQKQTSHSVCFYQDPLGADYPHPTLVLTVVSSVFTAGLLLYTNQTSSLFTKAWHKLVDSGVVMKHRVLVLVSSSSSVSKLFRNVNLFLCLHPDTDQALKLFVVQTWC